MTTKTNKDGLEPGQLVSWDQLRKVQLAEKRKPARKPKADDKDADE